MKAKAYFFSIVSVFSVVVPPGVIFVSVSVVFSVVLDAGGVMMVVSFFSAGGLTIVVSLLSGGWMTVSLCSQEKNIRADAAVISAYSSTSA